MFTHGPDAASRVIKDASAKAIVPYYQLLKVLLLDEATSALDA